ncbi:fibronectin type III domain-containing protein [Candidatus Dojkabacteria bacterium]|nr:fibronectin type III domain-containing protein [Candidatus Dojkabacteria bacterium]
MERLKNGLVFTLKIFGVGLAIGTILGLLLYLASRESETQAIIVTNLDSNSFSVFWKTEKQTETRIKLISSESKYTVSSDDRDDEVSESRASHHVTFEDLTPDSEYRIQVLNPYIPSFIPQLSPSITVKTKPVSEESKTTADRVYGTIYDEKYNGLSNVMVFLTLDDKTFLSSVTNDEGGYSFDINKLSPEEDIYIEKIYIEAEGYESMQYIAQSQLDQPVPSISLQPEEQIAEENSSKLSSYILADTSNSCYEDGVFGGVRVQCDTNVHWSEGINPNNCPDPSKFRLGLVAHYNHTYLYKPETVTLSLFDKETGEVILSNYPNGSYVSTALLGDRGLGKTYVVKAFNNGVECKNAGGEEVTITMAERTEVYKTVNIAAGRVSSQKCKKFGEHTASWIPIGFKDFKTISDANMRWAEVIAPDAQTHTLELVYYDTIRNADDAGISLILRIDNASNRKTYANNIIKLYDKLLENSTLPPNGLFIHAGHNEPNAAEYKDPNTEAKFISDVIKTIREEGYLSRNADDSGIKLIGPNLDLVNTDDVPGTKYSAKEYLNKMLGNSDFSGEAKNLYAMAVNHYMIGDKDISDDLKNFHNYLKDKGELPDKIFLTETGKINTEKSWDDFKNELDEIEDLDFVEVILIFDASGLNKDPDFNYHQDLWNDQKLRRELIDHCTMTSYQIPQEGSTDVEIENIQPSGNVDAPKDQPVPVSPSGSTVESSFNGSFDGEFRADGAPELNVPSGWHAWYDSCNGSCGNFVCDPAESDACRRPEYKKSTVGNRVISGGSLQLFTTYGTHNAGVYTTVQISGSGKRSVEFSVSGHGWSDGKDTVIKESFFGAVGIDPSGGVDPHSSSVKWSNLELLPNVDPEQSAQWKKLSISADTNSNKVTVFIRSNNQYPYRNSDSYWDNAELKVNGEKVSYIVNQDITASTGITADEEASVLGTSSIKVDDTGEYQVTSDEYHILSPYVSKFDDSNFEVRFYYDQNGNLTKDEGEEYLDDVEGIEISKVSEVVRYTLTKGKNFLSFPIYTEEISSASDLLSVIKEQGGYAVAVDSYFSGKWISYTTRENSTYGEDFDIQPARGYVVTMQKPVELTLRGSKYTKPVRIYMTEGWNLIGIHGSDKSYTASSFISAVNDDEEFKLNNVSAWNNSTQKYSGLQYEDSEHQEYGQDFPLDPSDGFFVRIAEGLGYFTP